MASTANLLLLGGSLGTLYIQKKQKYVLIHPISNLPPLTPRKLRLNNQHRDQQIRDPRNCLLLLGLHTILRLQEQPVARRGHEIPPQPRDNL